MLMPVSFYVEFLKPNRVSSVYDQFIVMIFVCCGGPIQWCHSQTVRNTETVVRCRLID